MAIVYTLDDNAGGAFAISGNNLVVAGPINFEATPSLQIVVRATDTVTGEYYAKPFTINVTGVNEAPTINSAIPDQPATVGVSFIYQFPVNTFADPEAGAITYTATLQGGAGLPSWLTFTPATRAFSGTPPTSETLALRVTATDTGGLATSDDFNLVVNPAGPTWTKQRAVTVFNGPTAATDYQQLVTLTSANFDFASAAANGSDIRVLASDATTPLAYWIEAFDATAQTGRVWFKVPSLAANGTYTAYLIYGVSTPQPTTANGNNVFLFFDDFAGIVGWNRYKVTNPIIKTAASPWRSNIVGDPMVLPPDAVTNEWGAYYFGATGTAASIGYMRSLDGGLTWVDGTANPIKAPAGSGYARVLKPSVIFWPADSTYYMAYAAENDGQPRQIRLASSTSRAGPFNDIKLLLTGDGSATESTFVDCPNFCFDGTVLRLYYSANEAVAQEPRNFCVATFAAGPTSTLTRYSGNPIATPKPTVPHAAQGLGGMSVRKLANGTFDVAYNSFDASGISRMGRLNSPDGYTFNIQSSDLMFELGPLGSWDRVRLYRPCIYTTPDGVDRLLYNALGDTENIGYAELTRAHDPAKWQINLQNLPRMDLDTGVCRLVDDRTSGASTNVTMYSKAYTPGVDTIIETRVRRDVNNSNVADLTILGLAATNTADFPAAQNNSQFMFIKHSGTVGDRSIRHQNRSAGGYGGEDVILAADPAIGTFQKYQMVKRASAMDYRVFSDAGAVLGSLVGNTDAPQGVTTYPLLFGGRMAGASWDWFLSRQYLASELTASVGSVTTIAKTGL